MLFRSVSQSRYVGERAENEKELEGLIDYYRTINTKLGYGSDKENTDTKARNKELKNYNTRRKLYKLKNK